MPYTDYRELLRALRERGYEGSVRGSSDSGVARLTVEGDGYLTGADYVQIADILNFYSSSWADEYEQHLLERAKAFVFVIY